MASYAIYERRGTPITWMNTGGDKLLNLKNLGFGAGRLGAFVDRGEGATPCDYEVRVWCAWQANPTAGEVANVAVCQSDGTHTDAGLTFHASNDAALNLSQFNAIPVQAGAVIAHTADTAEKGSVFRVRVTSRYFAPALYNASAAKNLADSDGVSAIVMTPIHAEIVKL